MVSNIASVNETLINAWILLFHIFRGTVTADWCRLI